MSILISVFSVGAPLRSHQRWLSCVSLGLDVCCIFLSASLFEIGGPRIAGGFIGFGALAMFGLSLLVRGVFDREVGSFIAGVLFQVPFIAWILFLVHQGFFVH
jgi:hypothetical protein